MFPFSDVKKDRARVPEMTLFVSGEINDEGRTVELESDAFSPACSAAPKIGRAHV